MIWGEQFLIETNRGEENGAHIFLFIFLRLF